MTAHKATVKEHKRDDQVLEPAHDAYEALRAAKLENPWVYHGDLEKAAHIERIQRRQENEKRRKEQAANEPPKDLTLAQLGMAKAKVERLENQLESQENEQSKLLAQKRNSTSAMYIVNAEAAIEKIREFIAKTERDLRVARKQVATNEQRLEAEETAKQALKSKYIALSTTVDQAIREQVEIERRSKIDKVMRQTEAPLITVENDRQAVKDQILSNFGPETLHEYDEEIAQMKTR